MPNQTIKNILVFPKLIIERAVDNEELPPFLNKKSNWALISIYSNVELISTPRRIRTLEKLRCKNYLSITFNDIEKEREGYILFNKSHAEQIISFVNKIKDKVETLVIHCTAGISRSGAVGLFVCKYLKLKEGLFWLQNPRVMPNNHILRILGTMIGINIKYQENNSGYQEKYARFKALQTGWR